MEQILSVFGIDWRLLIIQIVNFVLLLAVLRYFLYRPILDMIERRKALAEKTVRDAEEASVALLSAEEKAASIVSSARQKSDELRETLEKAARGREEQIIKAAAERQAQIIKAAEAEASLLKGRALEESKKEVAKLAVLSAEKILRERS